MSRINILILIMQMQMQINFPVFSFNFPCHLNGTWVFCWVNMDTKNKVRRTSCLNSTSHFSSLIKATRFKFEMAFFPNNPTELFCQKKVFVFSFHSPTNTTFWETSTTSSIPIVTNIFGKHQNNLFLTLLIGSDEEMTWFN